MENEKNIKVNAFWGVLNTIIGMIFPLLVLSYASRILTPNGIGVTQLATSVSSYFELFASLGIPLYATREIAKVRNDNDTKKIKASEIFLTSIINAVIIYLMYVIFIFVVYGGSNSFFVFLIYGTSIISTAIGVEWYFKGEEEFSYITIRNLIVRLSCLILIFLFVKSEKDLIAYSIIYIGSTLSYSIVNLIKFLNTVKPKFRKFIFFKHIKPALGIFVINIATTIYCSIDTIMLGYITGAEGEYNVGIYSVAFKITTAIITIITSINSIMLPRLSYYYEQNRISDIERIQKTCYKIVLMFSIPSVVACELLPENIIYLISGSDYFLAVPALRIIAPIILFVSLTNLIGIQIFYSSGHVKKTTISVLSGALCNVLLNSILIPLMGITGAAIGTLFAEFTVLVVQLLIGKELLLFNLIDDDVGKYILSTFIMTIIVLLIKFLLNDMYIACLILSGIIGIIVYFASLLALKENLVKQAVMLIKNKIKKEDK